MFLFLSNFSKNSIASEIILLICNAFYPQSNIFKITSKKFNIKSGSLVNNNLCLVSE